MMASDKDLIIKITAETDRAVKEIKKLTTEVKKFSKADDKLAKNSAKNTKTINTGFNKLGLSMGHLITGAAALGVAMKAIEFSGLAADAEQSADAFERIYSELGLNVTEEFEKIKEASKGLVSDSSIKQSAVTAASLGVPIEKLADLMEIARVKAREMGTTAEAAFNDLATGIGRGSPMILDNLGLTIKLADANNKLSKDIGKAVTAFTKEDKALALTNAVIDAGAESVERYGNASLTAKQNSQQFDAAIKGLKEKIGGGVLPVMNALTVATTGFINSFILDDAKAGLDELKGKLDEVNGKVKGVTEEAHQTAKELSDTNDITFGAVFDGANVITLVDEAKKDIEGAGTEIVFYPTVKIKPEQVEEERRRANDALSENLKIGIDAKVDTNNIISVINAQTKEIEKKVNLEVPTTVKIDEIKASGDIEGIIKNLEDVAELTVAINPNVELTEKALLTLAGTETKTIVLFDPDRSIVDHAIADISRTIVVDVVYNPVNAPSGLASAIAQEGGY